MRLLVITAGPMLSAMTLFWANRCLCLADRLLKTAEVLRRASEA